MKTSDNALKHCIEESKFIEIFKSLYTKYTISKEFFSNPNYAMLQV